jgi:acetate---CoA ligase (ADP-forming)
MLAQHGYSGRLYPVNPRHASLNGHAVYASIADVPEQVDLALVAVPAVVVPGVLRECAAAGVRHAVVLSSGFAEAGPDGSRLQAEVAEVVAQTSLRVCGPNAEGFFYPAARVCATFSPAVDPEHGYVLQASGPVAVVSQSGGLGFALLNRGRDLGLTCGAVVSTGNEVDLAWLDYVDYLLDEPSIKVVLGFVEGPTRRRGWASRSWSPRWAAPKLVGGRPLPTRAATRATTTSMPPSSARWASCALTTSTTCSTWRRFSASDACRLVGGWRS